MGILLSSGLAVTDLTFDLLIKVLAALIVIWYVVKQFLEMRGTAKNQIEREQSWDYAAKTIKNKESVWDNAVADIKGEREWIVKRYDEKLLEIEDRINKNHADTEAQLFLLTKCMRAVLKCLYDQESGHADEAIKAQMEDLDNFLLNKSHERDKQRTP